MTSRLLILTLAAIIVAFAALNVPTDRYSVLRWAEELVEESGVEFQETSDEGLAPAIAAHHSVLHKSCQVAGNCVHPPRKPWSEVPEPPGEPPAL